MKHDPRFSAPQHFIGTKSGFGCYPAMKKTTRKPLNRMTIFVISIFILAIIVAAVYLIGFTPGETPIAQ
ncbi:hypothetical protein A6U92_02185 [Agrobacterium rubi]|nr:hypothetical protein A6U92_02185 [Agrobacterium rubi]